MKKWYIRLDVQKQYDNELITMIKQDIYSNQLYISLFNNGKLVDTDDVATIAIKVDKADGTEVIGSGRVAADGLVVYVVDYQAISAVGLNTFTLKIVYSDSSLTTTSFIVKVIDDPFSGTDGSIESTSEYPLLVAMMQENTTIKEAELLRVEAELNRVDAEVIRENSEESRNINENIRISNEINRIEDDDLRNTKELERISAEAIRQVNEQARKDAEVIRSYNENAREIQEDNRQSQEAIRQANETTRKNQEDDREGSEIIRENNESTRQSQEADRVNKETVRESNESTRQSQENSRQTNEQSRIDAESSRVLAESGRVAAEQIRSTNESSRINAESGRVTAEQGRVDTEAARVLAEQAREDNYIEKINDFVAETERVESQYPTRLTAAENDIAALDEDFTQHINSNMPHLIEDLKNDIKYRYGLQISSEGNPQIIYEEVI